MTLYLDSSALVKRYVAEPGGDEVVAAMQAARRRAVSRVAYVETLRAIVRVAGRTGAAARGFAREWPLLDVVELDAEVAEAAGRLAVDEDLRTLDAIHLASALALPADGLTLATWDRRLGAAARARGLAVLPGALLG